MYSLKSAMVLTMLYLPYTLILRHESFFRFNRMMLLGIMVLSLLLPLCNIPGISLDRQPVVHAAQMQMIELGIPVNMLPELLVTAEPPSDTSVNIFMFVSLMYIIGMATVLAMRLWQVGRLWYGLKRGALWRQTEEGITVCCHAEEVMPFSWMNCIVISEQDYNESGREIILHETGHICNGHSWDVLILTLVEMLQWWNPVVYVLGVSLRDVHEYEADDYVLRQGVSAQEYQLLLIKKAVGSGSYAFANSFNHSLTKKRITMMKQSKSNPWMRSKALYVIPVAALALSAFATPKFIAPIEGAVSKLEGKSTENSVNLQTSEGKILSPGTDSAQTKQLTFINNKRATEAEMKQLDPKAITNMYVLGSESAAKLYGQEGKDGAVIIETEKKEPIHVKPGSLRVVVDGQEITVKEAMEAVKGKEIQNTVSQQSDGSIKLEIATAEPEDKVYDKPEVLPEYPGGTDKFWGYLREAVKYPQEALEWGVQGRIHVEFIVEKDGSISNVKLITGADKLKEIVVAARKPKDDSPEEIKKENEDKGRIALQEEAIRVVKAMPKWKPGTVGGKPVRTKFVLPIMFRLS